MATSRAARVAAQEWARTWNNPEQQGTLHTWGRRRGRYDLLWSYYENSVFETLSNWARYKAAHGLYQQVRSIYNPTRRLVDFYAGQIYPGMLSEDGSEFPDGVPLAIPLAKDTPDELRAAIAQFWQWSNWQSGKSLMVRFGACTGNVLVEINDDAEAGKVSGNIVWPGFVKDVTLDSTGNVKAYTLEYQVQDGDSSTEQYTYRKEVDGDSFRTFKDDSPFGFDDQPSVIENPYGFVPAVWAKHKDLGTDFGAPAIHGVIGIIDELNNLVSHAHDGVHKQINQPAIFWSKTAISRLGERVKEQSASTDYSLEIANISSQREKMLFLQGPDGGRVDSLVSTINPAAAIPFMEKLLAELEDQKPELTLYKQLREMSQVTGPGAQRMIGDAAAPVYEAQALYDTQSIKLFQMAVAIGGWRASQGDWGAALTRQQQKFALFDLESYAAGQLDFAILPRPLVPITGQERWTEKQAEATAIGGFVTAGVPLEVALVRDFGWSDAEVKQVLDARMEQIKRQQEMFGAPPDANAAVVDQVPNTTKALPPPGRPRNPQQRPARRGGNRVRQDQPQTVQQ